MKTRRLCAVIAAAATLLGGMAFGTAGAYAAGNASIEVRHSQEGHTYSAYKFASLTVDGDAVQVDTDADWVQAVTEAVVEANNAMDPAGTMPSEYDSNPAAFAATKTGDNDAAWFREFAKAMKAGTGVTADGTVAGNGGAATITEDGVGIGQTITYTITLDIPDAAAGYDTYPYYVKDVASKGLTVNKDFAAKIGDKDMSFTYVTEPTVDNDSGKTTTVLKFDLAGKSGQLVITYTAVVNKDIISAGNQVSNTAEVSRDNENWTPPVVFEAYTGEFAFHKYGVGDDANGLAGATFNVFEGSKAEGTPLKFVKLSDGEYRLAEADENGSSANVVSTTGNVFIKGLKSGEYTLKETGFVDGYAKNFVPTFTVKLTVSQEDGTSSVELIGTNNLGLASNVDKAIQVKNVKNVTQLPLTGAMGTALFTIAALVMAGAGLALVLRFRESDTPMVV